MHNFPLLMARALVWHDGVVAFVVVLILALLAWAVNYFNPPDPFRRILFVILVCVAIVVLLNLLLIIIDHQIINW